MGRCVSCGTKVNREENMEMLEDIFESVDLCGVESLPEDAQVVYEDKMCWQCYEKRC